MEPVGQTPDGRPIFMQGGQRVVRDGNRYRPLYREDMLDDRATAAPQPRANALAQMFNGTGIPERVNVLNSLFNPVTALGEAGQHSVNMLAPGRAPMQRVSDAGQMLTGMAGTVAPMWAASRGAVPTANALADAMTGINMRGGEFLVDEFGGVLLYGGGMSDPTQVGWTFKDVARKPALSAAENKRFAEGLDDGEYIIPLRSINATQPTVNPDFATGGISRGQLPFAIRKDGQIYLTDGHHRAVTAAEEGAQNIRTRLMDFDNTDKSLPLFDYADAKAASVGDDALLAELFGENLIEIVRKYGIAGAAAMLGVSAFDVEQAMAGQK